MATVAPLLSFGFLTWACIAYYAITRRSRALAAASVGYGVATAAVIGLIGADETADLPVWRDATAVVLWLIVGVVGTAHMAALVHGPRTAAGAGSGP